MQRVSVTVFSRAVLWTLLTILACSAASARDIQINFRIVGETSPTAASFGQDIDLQPMTYLSSVPAFTHTVSISHLETEVYTLAIEYGDQTYVLPLKLHRNSRPINLPIRFDGHAICKDSYVREAETPAQPGNIPQALQRYLLAAHLSQIGDTRSRCRDDQVDRLKRARISRGIQLATFRGSPFMPPENEPSEWARIIGESEARIYARQVQQAEAIALAEARQAAQDERDFIGASEVNAVLIARAAQSSENARLLESVGLTQKRLETDQTYLENLAGAQAEVVNLEEAEEDM